MNAASNLNRTEPNCRMAEEQGHHTEAVQLRNTAEACARYD